MCCHPGFIVSFIEGMVSRLSTMLKGPEMFEMVNEHWLHLKVTSCINPSQES